MNAFKSSEEMSSDILQDDKITTERWLNNYGEMTRWLKRAGKIEMTKASWLKWDTKNGGSTVLCLRLRSLTCGITHCISLYGACAIHVLIGFIVNGFIQSKRLNMKCECMLILNSSKRNCCEVWNYVYALKLARWICFRWFHKFCNFTERRWNEYEKFASLCSRSQTKLPQEHACLNMLERTRGRVFMSNIIAPC